MKTAQEYRRDLHQIPELGRCEYETKKYIVSVLEHLHCQLYYPTPTAVVAYFNGNKAKTICFRADMDGLEITEATNLAYSSRHSGKMHACGHDGHMAMLLEVAGWVDQHLAQLNTNLVCLFQPSEEDRAGALDILASHILEDLKVEKIFGMHLWPTLEENHLYAMPGAMLAASCEMDVHFIGRSVHAANREEGVDAIQLAAQFLNEAYQKCKRIKSAHLLSFGSFEASGTRNVVASDALLKGTLRTFDGKTYQDILAIFNHMISDYEKTGIKIELHLNPAYAYVDNDKMLFDEYQEILGIQSLHSPFFQAEDFGCYTKKYPCLFLLLGIGKNHLLHTSTFDFSEQVLTSGVEAYKLILLNEK